MFHVAHLHLTHVECLGCCAIKAKWCCLAVGWVTSDARIITLAKWDDQPKSAIPTSKLINFYSDVWFEDSASRPKVIENKMKRISICCKLRVHYNSKLQRSFCLPQEHSPHWNLEAAFRSKGIEMMVDSTTASRRAPEHRPHMAGKKCSVHRAW